MPRASKNPLRETTLPGVLLLSLSLLAVVVSILALLLLTVPTLRIVTLLSGGKGRKAVQRAGTSGFGPVPDGMEEVVEEPGIVRHLVGFHAKMLDNHLLHTLCDVAHRSIPQLST